MGTVTSISTSTSKEEQASAISGHRMLRVGALGSTFATAVLLATGGPAAALGKAGTKGLAKAPIAIPPAPATGLSFSQLTHTDLMLLACVAVIVIGALAMFAYHRRSASGDTKKSDRDLAEFGVTAPVTQPQFTGGYGAPGYGAVEYGQENAGRDLAGPGSVSPISPQIYAAANPTTPGWYPMAADPTLQNYWDGVRWTSKIRWDGTAWQQVA